MKISRAVCVALLSVSVVACGSSYRRAKVVKMVAVLTPDNLSDASECRVLWNDLARFGVEMDEASDEWNKVVLDSALFLIERGCVKRRHTDF